jgi:hypothetical protein
MGGLAHKKIFPALYHNHMVRRGHLDVTVMAFPPNEILNGRTPLPLQWRSWLRGADLKRRPLGFVF